MSASIDRAPQLSTGMRTFSAAPTEDWSSLVEVAQAADAAGVDRLVMSDHVVFGENFEAYRIRPRWRRAGGKQPTGPDGALARAGHDDCPSDRGDHAGPIRHQHPGRRPASSGRARQGGCDHRRAVRRPPRPRCRRGLAARGVRGGGSVLRGPWRLLDHTIEVCQTLWRERGRPCATPTSFRDIHRCPNRRSRAGVPIWVSGTVNARWTGGWLATGRAGSRGETMRGRRGRHRAHAGGRVRSGARPWRASAWSGSCAG